MRKILPIFLMFIAVSLASQTPGTPEVLRGEVWVDLEPIFGHRVDPEFPLSMETAARRALQEAALYFSGMIYGWSFHYDIGERARGIAEDFGVFEPMGEIRWGDPRMHITEVETRPTQLRIWCDYRLSGYQQRRLVHWRTGTIRNAQGIGFSQLEGPTPDATWLDIRSAALTDAARAAVREILRSTERNRPKEAIGFISLASFPRFFISSGQWVVVANFRVQINEIIPFAAH